MTQMSSMIGPARDPLATDEALRVAVYAAETAEALLAMDGGDGAKGARTLAWAAAEEAGYAADFLRAQGDARWGIASACAARALRAAEDLADRADRAD